MTIPNYIELTPQEQLGSTNTIDWVERNGDKVDYYSGVTKHTITYADAAAAQAAVDDWLDKANNPPVDPLDLVNGDIVRINRTADKGSPVGDLIFRRAPTVEKPYWVFEGLEGRMVYVSEPLTIFKDNP